MLCVRSIKKRRSPRPSICVHGRGRGRVHDQMPGPRHDERELSALQVPKLTFKSIRARAVILKLRRPVVARIATITDWPLILIDLFTEEGIVGRSYLEPYTIKTMRYLVPALHDFGEMLKGHLVAPLELYDLANDPRELTNLANDRNQAEAQATLRQMLKDGWRMAVPKAKTPSGSK